MSVHLLFHSVVFSNANSTAENTYHDRVWLYLAAFRAFKYKLMYETGIDNL